MISSTIFVFIHNEFIVAYTFLIKKLGLQFPWLCRFTVACLLPLPRPVVTDRPAGPPNWEPFLASLTLSRQD